MLFSQNTLFVLPQGRVAGVRPGEWIEYSLEWEQPPYEDYPIKVRREILEVSGSSIRVKITTWLSNGTVSEDTKMGDVSEGTGGAALMFIPANLTIGDEVRIQGLNDTKIQDEIDRKYLGVIRKVVYSRFTAKGYDIKAYWDKIKGAALEILYNHSSLGNNRIIVIDTNMFSTIPGNDKKNLNLGFYFALATTTVVLFSFMLVRKRKARRRGKIGRRFSTTRFLKPFRGNIQTNKQISKPESL